LLRSGAFSQPDRNVIVGAHQLQAVNPEIMPTQNLANKRIIIGISGGIAAYKAAELVRRLKQHGAQVRVVMTAAAQQFITPLTLQALSGNPVHTALLDTEAEAAMGHIALARWADALLIAPASADCIARIAQGRGDDLLTTLVLALNAPLALAPAMNQAMWLDKATQHNVQLLLHRGITLFGPAEGSQACGDTGPGRMLEAEELAECLSSLFATGALAGLRVTITAGPTREAIDPVRFISNHSSGKMGYALAEAAAEAGALTTLISGPVALPAPPNVNLVKVCSAAEMHAASMAAAADCDIFIATAAVADYRPKNVASQKIKKKDSTMLLELERNPDIISAVAALQPGPFCVGFAAETEKVAEHARSKLQRKGLDLIFANDVANTGIGFNSDENQVTLISAKETLTLELAPKQRLARILISEIAKRLGN
jgi:phosphopantothenoylcysteine decarboxylase/phosphopantothenate--cysteine ligase